MSLNLTAQNIRELEAGLSQTHITDLKNIKEKAEKIFEIDPFNEVATWYSSQLCALNEPLIFDQKSGTIYRFTWLRTFHHPVAIRIQKQKKKYN